MTICPKCGKELNDNAKFCIKCGTQINKSQIINDDTIKPTANKSTGIKRKKHWMSWIVVSLILILLIGGGLYLYADKNDLIEKSDTEAVTRYEWIAMLDESYGINEYESSIPYFVDVNKNNQYFGNVQATEEWGIFDSSDRFEGDKYVDGEYAAITALRAVGEGWIQGYKKSKTSLTKAELIEIAVEEGIITSKQKRKNLNVAECEEILERSVSFHEKIIRSADFEYIRFSDGVRELEANDYSSNQDFTEAIIRGEDFSPGDILIFRNTDDHQIAREVVSVNNGNYVLKDAEIDDFIDECFVCGTGSLDLENLIKSGDWVVDKKYGQESKYLGNEYDIYSTKAGKTDSSPKKISIEFDNGECTVVIEDDKTKVEKKINNIKYKISGNIEFNGYKDDLYLLINKKSTDGMNFWDKGEELLNYRNFDVIYDADYKIDGDFKILSPDLDDITLFEVVIPIGAADVVVEMKLHFEVDGSVGLSVEIPARFELGHDKKHGFSTKHEISAQLNSIYAEAEIKTYTRVELVPRLLGISLVDVEFDCGIEGDFKEENRHDADIAQCFDVQVYSPVAKLEVGGDSKENTALDLWDLKFSRVFISKDNAPNVANFHFEKLVNGETVLVEACTYNNKVPASTDIPTTAPTLSPTAEVKIDDVEEGIGWIDKCVRNADGTYDIFWSDYSPCEQFSMDEIIVNSLKEGEMVQPIDSDGDNLAKVVSGENDDKYIYIIEYASYDASYIDTNSFKDAGTEDCSGYRINKQAEDGKCYIEYFRRTGMGSEGIWKPLIEYEYGWIEEGGWDHGKITTVSADAIVRCLIDPATDSYDEYRIEELDRQKDISGYMSGRDNDGKAWRFREDYWTSVVWHIEYDREGNPVLVENYWEM